MKTSLLSKRWRNLWVSVLCLDFTFLRAERKPEATTFIDRFLFHHDDSKVRELCIAIEYEEKLALLVDSWIQFAVRHDVEVFDLDLVCYEEESKGPDYSPYKLPSSLFRCESLTSLKLRKCDLNLPAAIQLNSLKTLCFKYTDLNPSAIEHITSNCPLLEDLTLEGCNKAIDLNICITNDNVKKLKIYEYERRQFDNGITTINSPNLISLQFFCCLPRTKYHVKNLRSLVTADFSSVVYDIGFSEDVFYGESTGCDFAQLLNDLRHVKELKLSDWCIQLSEEFVEEYDFEVKDFWNLLELDSSSVLQNVKIIRIIDFHNSFWDDGAQNWDVEIEFVKFLLKTSKVLEGMTIETCDSSRKHINLMLR